MHEFPCTLGKPRSGTGVVRVSDPDAVVWKGDGSLPTANQGVVVLGAPLGHADFVARKLEAKTDDHRVLFRRILAVQDLQCAWLLLFCAATRANYFLRVVQPALSQRFAAAHDEDVWSCIQELLGIEGTTRVRQLSSLPFALGGLGLRSAVRGRIAAYWASWADTLPRIRERHPRIADLIGASLFPNRFLEGSCLQAAALCRDRLLDVGFSAPEWGDVGKGQRLGRAPENRDPTEPPFGWQCLASAEVEKTHLQGAIWPKLSPTDFALLRFQCGPFAGIPFTCSPVVPVSRLEPQIFRVLLLRRLWCRLPLSTHSCRCGRLLDARGHHRAACGRAGVLGRRGFPLESAAARVCREAGGRVSVNVRVADLDLVPHGWIDNRKIEVVADGLPLFHGARLAVDVTIVSSVRGDGSARRQCADLDGAALHQARQKKATTYPELAHPRGGRARLVVLGCEVGRRWSEEARNFVSQLAKAKSRWELPQLRQPVRHAWFRRRSTLLACSAARSFALSPLEPRGGLGWMGTHRLPRLCSKSSGRSVGTGELSACWSSLKCY